MSTYQITLVREFTQSRDQSKGIEFIKRRVLSSKPAWEIINTEIFPVEEKLFNYIYRVALTFRKTSGQKQTEAKEWLAITQALTKIGEGSKFRPCVWKIESSSHDTVTEPEAVTGDSFTKHAMSENIGITLQDVKELCLEKITQLLTEKDAIQNSEYFRHIFERDAQIRIALSSIKSFLETNGERRNHILLYGLPACAKTEICNAITRLVSEAAVVRLDGTSTTPAGIYKTYFENFADLPEPPFVVLEECEKTSEESLRVWLGVLDYRGELRKVNYREQAQRTLKVLCIATANDKEEFDLLMGGTAKKPGALSSRFVHQVECQRPNEKVLRMILERDIVEKGGKMQWVDAVIELAKATRTDDPRKVLAYLDGGDRLETGEYQADILAVYKVPKPELITFTNEELAS